MSSAECTSASETASSILFAHAADDELKSLVLPCLQGFRELYTAESGGETLELYCANLPCMVVAPLTLGDMSGFELCSRILAVRPEAQIVLVGRERGESVYRRAMEAGVARYVVMDEDGAASLQRVIEERYTFCEFRRTQQQMAASYRLGADALQTLPMPVAVLTAEGQLLSGNRAFSNLVGFERDNYPAALAVALGSIPATEPANGWDGLLEAAAKGEAWSGTVTRRGENGASMCIRAALSHIETEQGGPCRQRLLVLNDITAHEEQLAHLSVQRDSAFELLESIHAASDIEAMKSLARLLTAAPLPAAHVFSLRTLIASVTTSLFERAKDLGKEVRSTVPTYLPDLFLGREDAIYRVLSNLLGNALATSEGAEIQLKVELKGKNRGGTSLQFSVEFSSSSVAANCFESMQEYMTSLNLEEEGALPGRSGLSLATALVETLGGATWVRSMVNHGCAYCFSLSVPEASAADAAGINAVPVSDATPAPNDAPRFGFICVTEPHSAAKPRILLADDNEVDQLRICRLLESLDYEVIRVANGREAVEEFDTSTCDAVLMDILMPVMDGFEATRMIREKERLVGAGHTPIIALTSYSLKAIHEKCLAVGMDSHLHKPVSAQDLGALLRSVLHSGQTTGSAPQAEETGGLPLIDVQNALNNLDNNSDLYREIITLFIAKFPAAHQDLITAVTTGAIEAILQSAHKIKGMTVNVGATRYAELAGRIEDATMQGDLGDSARWRDLLATEFKQLQEAITAIDWHELR